MKKRNGPSALYREMERRLAPQIAAGVTGKALDALIRHELHKLIADGEYLVPSAKDNRIHRRSSN
jgi:hypothetical protein